MDGNFAAVALVTGACVWALAALAATPRNPDRYLNPIERRRRAAVRAKSFVYRHWENLVCGLAAVLGRVAPRAVERVGKSLDALAEDDWRADEYLAARLIALAPALAALVAVVAYSTSAETTIAAALLLVAASPVLVVSETRSRAEARLKQIRARLPYTLDLMALVLEAGGGTLFDCLRLGAAENAAHPLGDEFRRIVLGIDTGSPPAEVLADTSRRLADPDVSEVALAIATSETRGLPLKESLRAVGVRLRTRRVQAMERASERAKVNIIWPAMVVMGACMLIVVALMVIGSVGV